MPGARATVGARGKGNPLLRLALRAARAAGRKPSSIQPAGARGGAAGRHPAGPQDANRCGRGCRSSRHGHDLSRRARRVEGRHCWRSWLAGRAAAGPLAAHAGGLVAVAAYAALGGGGPAARGAIMGALLVLAPGAGAGLQRLTALALAALLMAAVEACCDSTTPASSLPRWRPWPAALHAADPRWPAGAWRALAAVPRRRTRRRHIRGAAGHAAGARADLRAGLARRAAGKSAGGPLLAPLLCSAAARAGGAAAGRARRRLPLALGWVAWPLLWTGSRRIALCAHCLRPRWRSRTCLGWWPWVYYALLAAVWWGARPDAPLARPSPWPPPRRTPAGPCPRQSRQLQRRRTDAAHTRRAGRPARADAAGRVRCGGPRSGGERRRRGWAFLDVGPGGEATLLRLPSGATALLNGGPQARGWKPRWRGNSPSGSARLTWRC